MVALPRNSPIDAGTSPREIEPLVGGMMPARARTRVVLPEPERPTTAVIVPGRMTALAS